MNQENKRLLKELERVKLQKDILPKAEYLRQLKCVINKVRSSMAREVEVDYEEVKILSFVNKIINS